MRFEYPPKWFTYGAVCLLHGWCWYHVKLLPSQRTFLFVVVVFVCLFVLYIIQPCTSLQYHFIRSHVRCVHVCLILTCSLHFRPNDRDLLRATTVTRGWNGYRNKRQHTQKMTQEKKNKILLSVLPGLDPATFRSRVRRSVPLSCPCSRRRVS